ncbi:MAG TPA: hypothetical protein VL155_18405 [Terriglobales bacterium]|nr:hypothetical protein [Terriglobales bacterium]
MSGEQIACGRDSPGFELVLKRRCLSLGVIENERHDSRLLGRLAPKEWQVFTSNEKCGKLDFVGGEAVGC